VGDRVPMFLRTLEYQREGKRKEQERTRGSKKDREREVRKTTRVGKGVDYFYGLIKVK
jgi:hypothetical protein